MLRQRPRQFRRVRRQSFGGDRILDIERRGDALPTKVDANPILASFGVVSVRRTALMDSTGAGQCVVAASSRVGANVVPYQDPGNSVLSHRSTSRRTKLREVVRRACRSTRLRTRLRTGPRQPVALRATIIGGRFRDAVRRVEMRGGPAAITRSTTFDPAAGRAVGRRNHRDLCRQRRGHFSA
jgi:hypothetical protein